MLEWEMTTIFVLIYFVIVNGNKIKMNSKNNQLTNSIKNDNEKINNIYLYNY